MPLADFAAYRSAVATPIQQIHITKNSHAQTSAQFYSTWASSPIPGATPTTAVALDRTAAGCWGQQNASSGMKLYLAQLALSGVAGQATAQQRVNLFLFDRLSHQGGLSGTAGGAQTTNLPTAALTRYTSGVGVMAALEVYTATGATPTTVTVSYTNQAGASGQTSKAAAYGGTSSALRTFTILSLQDGDTGVKSVESVTLAGSTGGVGNFGVTLFKPLGMFISRGTENMEFDAVVGGGCVMPEIINDACLFICNNGSSNNASPVFQISARFIEA